MKIVLDTNILVSAFAVGGKPAQVLDLIVNRAVGGVTSERLMGELMRILKTKFAFSEQQLRQVRKIIRSPFVFVRTTINLPAISRDPDDNHVLAVAQEAKADFIVSGDKDLLVLKEHSSIPIVTASDFLEKRFKTFR